MSISVVITSYNRPDLLQNTVESFIKFNTYPIEEFIIIEDSGDKVMKEWLKNFIYNIEKESYFGYKKFTTIINLVNIGLVESIDKAYSQVKTPYLFHSEDDYRYIKEGFIEKSLSILESSENIMQVYIRGEKASDNPVEPKIYNGEYKLFGNTIEGYWHGFCFQCGLRKMDAYNRIKPFSKWSNKRDQLSVRECKIGQVYYNLGYRVAVLPEIYAEHTGRNRSTCGNWNI
jgi:GT2 family glycosyltransferase